MLFVWLTTVKILEDWRKDRQHGIIPLLKIVTRSEKQAVRFPDTFVLSW